MRQSWLGGIAGGRADVGWQPCQRIVAYGIELDGGELEMGWPGNPSWEKGVMYASLGPCLYQVCFSRGERTCSVKM